MPARVVTKTRSPPTTFAPRSVPSTRSRAVVAAPASDPPKGVKRIEWQLLYRRGQGGALPAEPPSLREAVRWTALLGGFLGRKGDGEPGVKVLWRSLMRLQDIVVGFLLASAIDVGKAQPNDDGNNGPYLSAGGR